MPADFPWLAIMRRPADLGDPSRRAPPAPPRRGARAAGGLPDNRRVAPRPASRLALCALLACLAAPAGGVDLERVELDLRPGFDEGTLALTARLEYSNPRLEREIVLGLSERFDRVAVALHGESIPFEREGGWIALRLEQPTPTVVLEFELAGAAGASDDERRPVLTRDDLFLLWSDRFYPIDFEDWALFRIDLTLPPGFEAIAPGRLVERVGTPAGVRWRFETSHPARNVSVFADRRWRRTAHEVGGRAIETLFHPESAPLAGRVARASADVLAFFEELHGGYPFDGFAFVTLDGIYARRAFPGFVGYSPAYLAREMERTGHDAHETSLLWWGYAFGGRGPGAFQWLEGLGDYVEILYDEARGHPVPAIFERFRAEYLASPREEEPAISELRGSTPQKFVHGKYPWLLHVLRGELGLEALRAGVRRLASDCAARACSLDEVVAALEAGSGRSLERWRRQWLERRGVPELEYAVVRAGEGLRLRVVQRGELYDLPLEVALDGPAGRLRVVRVDLLAVREQEVDLGSAEGAESAVLDPERKLLLRLREVGAP